MKIGSIPITKLLIMKKKMVSDKGSQGSGLWVKGVSKLADEICILTFLLSYE